MAIHLVKPEETREAQKREKEAFETYFDRYYAQAVGYVQKRLNHPADAEDLVMSVFLACYRNFDRFDPSKASFSTWLYVAIDNRLKNFYRDRRDTEELPETLSDPRAFQDEIEEAMRIGDLRAHLAEALEQLSEEQRRIVVLKYFYEKNATEIAALTDLAPGNVRVHLSRAMAKLRNYFQEKGIRWE